MIPFGVIVRDVLRDGRSEVSLAERNQPVQAFFFDGPHEPFGVGNRIGSALGREDDTDAPRLGRHGCPCRSLSEVGYTEVPD